MTGVLDIAQYLDRVEEVKEEWLVPVHHLSPSSLAMFDRCPEQWRNRYVLGRKERPGEALVLGTAVHLTVEKNFTQKITSHEDLPTGELVEWFDDEAFPAALSERQEGGEEVQWDTGPDGARRRGRAITLTYHDQVAPRVQPLSVETRVEADFGIAVPVIGYADCITEGPVIDVKTGKSSRTSIKPEWRYQAAIYSTITRKAVDFHCASASPKTHRATVNTPLQYSDLSVWLSPEAREEVRRNVGNTAWAINQYMRYLGPDQPWPTQGYTHPWACSWCGFKPGCPAWKGQLE